MRMLLIFIVSYLVFLIEVLLVCRLEKDEIKVHPERRTMLISAGVLLSTSIIGESGNIAVDIATGFFWGSLVAAAYSDWQIKKAYRFFFHIAFLSAIAMMFLQETDVSECIWDIVIFLLLQWLLFQRMYGRADCMGFGVCAVFFAVRGHEIFDYLCLMGVTFLLVFLVQALKKNINKEGNLKTSIALLPYITAAALIFYI